MRAVIGILLLAVVAATSAAAYGQFKDAPAAAEVPAHVRSSAAYAQVLLRSTEIQAEITAVADDYTDTNPRLADLRSELKDLQASAARLSSVKPSDASRLTDALGRLMVRHAGMAAELAHLRKSYTDEHPEVRRAKKRLDVFDQAITDILK